MNIQFRTALAALLMMLAPLAATGVSADHGPTSAIEYVSGCVETQGCGPGDVPGGLGAAVVADADEVQTWEAPEPFVDYPLPTSMVHAVHSDKLPSAWADGRFYLEDLQLSDDFQDLDGDGRTDLEEIFDCNANPLNPASTCEDPDADGLKDTNGDGSEEFDGDEVGTERRNPDTDGDGYDDGDEVRNGYDPLDPADNPRDRDSDGDGLADQDEPAGCDGTTDCDSDGLQDGAEVHTHETDPEDSDHDDDGLLDGAEVNTHGTDPKAKLTDEDDLEDGEEVLGTASNYAGDSTSDPLVADTDGDGADDDVEAGYTEPGTTTVTSTNPNGETDTDGLSDGLEIGGWCVSPLGLPADLCFADPGSVEYTSNPFLDDTDGDGFDDLAEHDAGTDPRDVNDHPGAGTSDPGTGGLPAGDSRDEHDVDDDGDTAQPNGQVDLVEEVLLYVDEDEGPEDDDGPDEGLEGDDGFTLVVLASEDPIAPGVVAPLLTVRVGDVSASPAVEEAVFIFHGRGGAPVVSVCVLPEATPPVTVGTGFYPENESDPCNEPSEDPGSGCPDSELQFLCDAAEDPPVPEGCPEDAPACPLPEESDPEADDDGDGTPNGEDVCPDDADHADGDGDGTPDCAEEADPTEDLPDPTDPHSLTRALLGGQFPPCSEANSDTLVCLGGDGVLGIRLRILTDPYDL